MQRTVALRRGMRAKVVRNSVQWSNSQPQAELMNQGGEIEVTSKMKCFFWAMYYKASGGITYNVRKKQWGTPNANKIGNSKLSKLETRYMKLANEFVSRKKLPYFIKRLGGKIENESYTFQYQIKDEQSDLEGVVTCDNETSTIDVKNNNVSIFPTELGDNTITITTIDGFGVQIEKTVKIVAFENLQPVARFEVKADQTLLSQYERRIDTSKSFDQDEKFGGKIKDWEFRINNQAFIRKSVNYSG